MRQVHPLTRYRLLQTPPLSQDGLAKLLKVSRVAVTRWEDGSRNPDKTALRKIREVTGIAPRDLRPDLAELIDNRAEASA